MVLQNTDSEAEKLPASHKLGLLHEKPAKEVENTLIVLGGLGELLTKLHEANEKRHEEGGGNSFEIAQLAVLESDLRERLSVIGYQVNIEQLNTEEGVSQLVMEATDHLKETMLHQVKHAFEAHPDHSDDIWAVVEAFHTDYARVVRGLDDVREAAYEHLGEASVINGGWKRRRQNDDVSDMGV